MLTGVSDQASQVKRRRWGVADTALRSCAAALGLLIFGGLLQQSTSSLAASATPTVKLSRSGICHDKTSTHYARLKEYQSFNTMQECIAAGGRPSRGPAKKPDSLIPDTLGGVGIGWWLLAGIAAIVAIAVPLVHRWHRRRQNKKTQEAFEEAEEKRWRGHRIDK